MGPERREIEALKAVHAAATAAAAAFYLRLCA